MSREDKKTLMPGWLFFSAVAISLALPNLIYSGTYFFQTLHLMKWTFALVPVAFLTLVSGIFIAWKGADWYRFKVDTFGWVWFVLILYVTIQPLWIDVRSIPTFYREWFFLLSLWGMYILCYNGFKDRWLTPLLWLASLNGAVNVLFAELQVADRVDFFSPLKLILPTPGNYIGNTGQQNMLGLWLSITALGSVFIYLRHGIRDARGWLRALVLSNIAFMFIILWGLWNSTSRSAILALMVGLFAMGFIILMGKDRLRLKRLGVASLLMVVVLGLSVSLNSSRSGSMISKAVDLVENADTIGGRQGIWRTSWVMYRSDPIKGYGLGQFKWNYLEAQKKAFKIYPDFKWQYTNWAHNEYLQWFCETGLFGGIILLGLGLWWLIAFFRYVYRHRGEPFSDGVLWGCSFLFLIWFDALWTRPFHRIENSLWLSVAFAVANRQILMPDFNKKKLFSANPRGYRALGIVMSAIALWGGVYLAQGIDADITMRKAVSSRTAPVQRSLLEKASKSLMVSDLAQKQLAYHYISYGKFAKDPEALADGLNRLLRVFRSQPTAKELRTLIEWASRLRKKDLLVYVTSYLKPGSYKIKTSK